MAHPPHLVLSQGSHRNSLHLMQGADYSAAACIFLIWFTQFSASLLCLAAG
jgi:hypothetical protein